MLSQEIRRNFLKYFKDHHHRIVPSSSVVPHDDPTLLFTNAGMNQFKDVFLGKTVRDYKTAATSQKCIRVGGKHNDLDNVGHTSRHLTFFEMLGNFSFGDYFKEQAITYAWEVSTQVYQFDPDKIWITVFREDDEAAEIWKKIVPADRIVRMDEADNFWAMGETGPCGPCSELYYDRGTKYGDARSVKDDLSGERYIEFWNLVFMQFNRDANGKMTPLPKQSIDTGSGLERVVALKMGVDNVFATDILHGLILEIEQVSGKKYNMKDLELAPAFHVIADHIRSLSFAIADGAQPSNVERGYVLRKLLRRAVRYGRMLGIQDPFLAKILPRLVALMGDDYPELKNSESRIAELLTLEE
ncbi:MAG TPA: alanine--tRNA ligase, partial [Rhabdochlamydiaceae bacterium]|nr:alanine--tRNA ligase [Rhabdochlamydiaceae bacterium]